MLELYFILYRIPKMMSEAARERGRSAVAWSLIGIGAWIGSQIIVGFGIGMTYAIVVLAQGSELEDNMPAGITLLIYVLSLGAAILSVTLVKRILTGKPKLEFEPPPPPPTF